MSELDRFESLKARVKEFPTQPGIYLMKSQTGKIIYVGKAKILRNRVRSYFLDTKDMSPKTRLLVQNIFEVEYILTKTEVEAFLLEASMIKKHRPKYNIRLKDDKAYPYIKFTFQEEYPRLYLARKVQKDGAFYFGPYTSGGAVHGTIRFLNRTFKIRDCTDPVFKSRSRPCMTHQIGRCTAPCVKLINQKDYHQEIEGALFFLKGQDQKAVSQLKDKMMLYASEERFELAARLRDSIRSIEAVLEKQAVINSDITDKDQDAIGFYGDERGVLIETVHIRGGRVIGIRPHFLPQINPHDTSEDVREWFVSFINQYYEDNIIPDEILLAVEIGSDLIKLFEAVMLERAGRKVTLRYPTDEKGRDLIEMANENAKSYFEKYVNKSQEKQAGLDEIQKKLNLPQSPQRIECYDISNFQGQESVASQVVFEEGVPSKEHYRRYKIKTVEGANDYASMKEVLSRRFEHHEYEEPQLIVVDGGKGQLGVAVKVLQEIGKAHIPIVGLAKSRTQSDFQDQEVSSTEERVFIPGRQNPVVFARNAQALHILTGIRDEAHRFAITYHRKLREATTLESELDLISGLGPQRKKILLKKFQSVEELKDANVEEIATLKSFNRVLAERILLHLNESDENE